MTTAQEDVMMLPDSADLTWESRDSGIWDLVETTVDQEPDNTGTVSRRQVMNVIFGNAVEDDERDDLLRLILIAPNLLDTVKRLLAANDDAKAAAALPYERRQYAGSRWVAAGEYIAGEVWSPDEDETYRVKLADARRREHRAVARLRLLVATAESDPWVHGYPHPAQTAPTGVTGASGGIPSMEGAHD